MSSTSTIFHLLPPSPSSTQCFLKISVLSFLSLLPHLTNSSSLVTLTSILIILLTILPVSFCLSLLFHLTQHVNFPTHDKNNILDLFITSADTSLVPAVFSPNGLRPVIFLYSPNSLETQHHSLLHHFTFSSGSALLTLDLF